MLAGDVNRSVTRKEEDSELKLFRKKNPLILCLKKNVAHINTRRITLNRTRCFYLRTALPSVYGVKKAIAHF